MKLRCKGTVLSLGVAGASAAIAQVISFELPEVETETFEADTLDNADPGIPYKPTGRVEGGSISGELFLDYAIHTCFTSWLASPPDFENSDPAGEGSVAFVNSTGMSFNFAGLSLGGTVALKDGLKGKFSAKLDGIPTYDTTS